MIICLKASKSVKSVNLWSFYEHSPSFITSQHLEEEFSLVCCDPRCVQQAHGQCSSLPTLQCILSPWQGSWKLKSLDACMRVILIVIFPFFTILIIFLTWWKHLENDFWQLMVQTIVIDRMPQGQSTISVPLLFYSDANWLLLSTTHLWGVRWESWACPAWEPQL